MGFVAVAYCDMCGKRTETLPGKMMLYSEFTPRGEHYSKLKTVRSWRMCKTCLNKTSALEAPGDKIRENIEVMIDYTRTESHKNLIEGYKAYAIADGTGKTWTGEAYKHSKRLWTAAKQQEKRKEASP
jgi:hypothetical protein